MADPLSIGASVLAFIGLADRIIRLSKFCIDGLKDAPSDIRMIHGEVSSLRAIIDVLAESKASSFLENNAALLSCHRCLSDLETLLPSDAGVGLPRRRLTIAELAWPLKQSKARKTLVELSQHKATLLLIISGDVLHELRAIKTTLHEIQNNVTESERRSIQTWLEQTNPSRLHNAAISKHEPETCAWLTRSDGWKLWTSSTSPYRMLWIYGIPGAGKTVLASFAIEKIRLLCEGATNYVYAYYYCHYYNAQDEAIPLLRWVVAQVSRQLGWAPVELKRLHDRGCEPTVPELQHILELALARLERLFIIVDAVDESMPRDEIIRLLATISLDARFYKVRILATSRHYGDIERFFSAISSSISMKNPYVDSDIQRHIRARFQSSMRLRRWQNSFQAIEEALVSGANGMFRWVDCQLHSIERLGDKTKLASVLQDLPRDLTESYIRIFEAIPEVDQPFIKRILLWVYGDSRTHWDGRGINGKLLLEAVSFDLYGIKDNSFDWAYLQDLCGCLIAVRNELSNPGVTDGDSFDDGASCWVTLAHYTVWEFLSSYHILSTPVSAFATSTEVAERQYAVSILRNALAARPEDPGTHWRRDREAYCLVVGCMFLGSPWLQTSEDLDLFYQFMDPQNPHYRRFGPIQARALRGEEDFSSHCFFILAIPSQFRVPEQAFERENNAEVVLNAHLLKNWLYVGAGRSLELPAIGRLSQDEVWELGKHQVAGHFIRLNKSGEVQEIGFDGRVWDITSPPTRRLRAASLDPRAGSPALVPSNESNKKRKLDSGSMTRG
ncbi:Putative protein of unknown function [Podospora comata]|uniref:Nephrocystin 3-like N-terminal domain-containing protein n=1 Tax=Podospora comata TaxID=48703 RepID=A0ABY6RTY2_PODCO|nr:Putative protein of unknown function [Podospora comata]